LNRQTFAAWCAHAFTASGCVLGFLAFPAIARGDYRMAFVWIAATAFIDGIDGTFARAARVKQVLPHFDGKMLDYCIDFVNFVISPAYVLYAAGLIEPRYVGVAVAAVLLVSSYHYGNLLALTPDGYFKGFPAWWNIVIFYLFVLQLEPRWNLVLVLVFCVLHFVPIKWIVPSHTRRLRPLNVTVTLLAAITAVGVIVLLPAAPRGLIGISVGCCLFMMAASIVHTFLPEEVRA
jgi:phosphatidylcholine synthase